MSAAAEPSRLLRRDTRHGLVAGVLAGFGDYIGVDPVLLRILFVVAVVATGGLLLLAYLVAWAAMPAGVGGKAAPVARWVRGPRIGGWRVAVGAGLLTLSALLAFRELGIWWSDALVWPLVLAAFGVALLWARSRLGDRYEHEVAAPTRPSELSGPAARPGAAVAQRARAGFAEHYGGIFGILLVAGAALLVLSSTDVLGGLRDIAVTVVVVIVAVALILAPFLWRLGQSLAAERAERIRSQERAQLAAHLHDSVLQTLTLMQKRASDPREVTALARRQERELREWLSGEDAHPPDASFASALRAITEEVEDDHRVAVELVVVGDRDLDDRTEALLAAAREALVNAARHAGEPESIRVYAEVDPAGLEVFIRDRGAGFDPAAVPADRRGVRESIVGRMERAGGRAEIRSSIGDGTEVALIVPRDSDEAAGAG
jgi:signal transduction histidine kinase/phage shock protein PspC (stress-responsive transcriptional regulator)